MKKGKKFEWTEEFQEAFDKLKAYLASPTRISRPLQGESVIVYLAASEIAVSAALVREDEEGQKPVYF